MDDVNEAVEGGKVRLVAGEAGSHGGTLCIFFATETGTGTGRGSS